MKDLLFYLRLGFPWRRAIYLAFGRPFGIHWRTFWNAVYGLGGALAVVLAYSLVQWVEDKPTPAKPIETSAAPGYTKALEKLTAACLTPGDKAVTVGSDIYLIGAYKL